MQKKKGEALQATWGNAPCDHPAFAKEYDDGTRTGDFRCTQCGASISFRLRAELMASRQPADADAPTSRGHATPTRRPRSQ